LGKYFPNHSLDSWRIRVGESEANKISGIALRRGSQIHLMAESYILGTSDWKTKQMPVNTITFTGIKEMLDKHVDNIRGIELPLYSHKLKTAGRTDLVAEFDGKLSIIDYKTSKREKSSEDILNYFLQSTCYAMMFEEIYNIPIERIVILMTIDFEKPKFFRKDPNRYKEQVLEIFT
jgi:hypothetical protein